MTSDTSPRPISPLRARMIEDMTVRGFKQPKLIPRLAFSARSSLIDSNRVISPRCLRFTLLREPSGLG